MKNVIKFVLGWTFIGLVILLIRAAFYGMFDVLDYFNASPETAGWVGVGFFASLVLGWIVISQD